MKKEQGITLISLVVYIIGMIVIMAIVGSVLSFYNNNMVRMNDTSDVNIELSKLETQMVMETHTRGNYITGVTDKSISFSSGNTYAFTDNRIYQNTIPVSNYVQEFLASMETDGEKQILRLYIVISKGNVEEVKNLSYVVESKDIATTGQKSNVLKDEVTHAVYGKVYKVSDTEYHLVLNKSGSRSNKYTEAQLQYETENMKALAYGYWEKTGLNTKITKAIITEEIQPTNTSYWFHNLSQMKEIENIDKLNTSNVTNMGNMFCGCSSLSNIDVSKFDTSKVMNMENIFHGCSSVSSIDISNWDTSNVTNMGRMFQNCTSLSYVNVSNLNTSKTTDIHGMFYGCSSLSSIDVSNWDTSRATDMHNLFNTCTSLSSIDVSKWNTSKVTTMNGMFYYCKGLSGIGVSNWDTSSLTDIHGMFNGCVGLSSIDVSKWDTSKVTDMASLFNGCQLSSIDVSKWDTSQVTDMHGMFNYCSKLTSLDLSNFNTGKVTKMYEMFNGAYRLKTIYVSNLWTTTKVTSSANMFKSCTVLVGTISYDANKVDVNYANYTTGYLTYKANN